MKYLFSIVLLLSLFVFQAYAQFQWVRWGTQYGGTKYDGVSDLKLDAEGNIYVVGTTLSEKGIAKGNVFQDHLNLKYSYWGYSGENAFLAKFTPKGDLIWGTYIGGDKTYGQYLDLDDSGNIYVTGRTNSRVSIASSGAHQEHLDTTKYKNEYDAFLAKFTPNGQLVWGTYFGGNITEEVNAIKVTEDAVYIVGNSTSDSGIATPGAHRSVHKKYFYSNAIGADAFLAKFDLTGSLLWSTYYGDNRHQKINSIDIDKFNNIYFTGDYIYTYFIPTKYEEHDVLLGVFDSSGSLTMDTLYSWKDEWGNSIKLDISGNIYIGGVCGAFGPATTGAYQEYNNGVLDGMVMKLSSSGNIIWFSYYGGNYVDYINQIALDDSGYIYLRGKSNSDSQITTVNSYIPNRRAAQYKDENFIAKLSPDGSNRIWASYFGTYKFPALYNISIDPNDQTVLLAGATDTLFNPATSGAYQDSIAGEYDGYIVRLNPGNIYYDVSLESIEQPGEFACNSPGNMRVFFKNYCADTLKLANFTWSLNGVTQKKFTWNGTLNPGDAKSIVIDTPVLPTGTHTIKIWVSNPNNNKDQYGWNDTLIKQVAVHPLPTIIKLNDTSFCEGDTAVFVGKEDTSINTHIWYMLPNKNFVESGPVVTLSPDTSTYYLHQVWNKASRCFSEDTFLVTVFPKPKKVINGQKYACENNVYSYNLKKDSTDSISWHIEGGAFIGSTYEDTVFIRWDSLSDQQITAVITSDRGCSQTTTFETKVNALPGIPIIQGDTSICKGSISGYSIPAVVGVSPYWSVDGGELLSKPDINSISVRWEQPGIGKLKLKLRNSGGCEDSTVMVIEVKDPPIAAFGYEVSCQGEVVFKDSSKVGSSPYKVFWDFGDGDTSSGKIVTHWYGHNWTYKVKLTLISEDGCSEVTTQNVKIGGILNPEFSFSKGCPYDSIKFYNQTVGDTAIKSWYWDFGDGHTSSLKAPRHLYSSSGMYGVILAVENQNNCRDTIRKVVEVYPMPEASFKAIDQCGGNKYSFQNKTLSSDSSLIFLWDFGNGYTSTSRNPMHQYAAEGTYNVKLKAINSSGCSDTVMEVIRILPELEPNFSFSNVCLGDSVVLYNSTKNDSGVDFKWSFGDGTSTNERDPYHMYSSSGTYNIVLKATRGSCTDSLVKQVSVYPLPSVNIIKSGDTLTAAGGSSYRWYINDSLISGANGAMLIAENKGYYHVKTTDNNGCDAASEKVFVDPVFIESRIVDQLQVKLYPNPFSNTFTVELNLSGPSNLNLSLFEITGKEIFKINEKSLSPGRKQIEVDLSLIKPGVYFLEIQSEEGTAIKKIVKK